MDICFVFGSGGGDFGGIFRNSFFYLSCVCVVWGCICNGVIASGGEFSVLTAWLYGISLESDVEVVWIWLNNACTWG